MTLVFFNPRSNYGIGQALQPNTENYNKIKQGGQTILIKIPSIKAIAKLIWQLSPQTEENYTVVEH